MKSFDKENESRDRGRFLKEHELEEIKQYLRCFKEDKALRM